MSRSTSNHERWPALPLADWQDTFATLNRYCQIVGKISLKLTPRVNQWWNVAFRITSRGFTTGLMTYEDRAFSIEFDFIDHEVIVQTSRGERRSLPLYARAVADFHDELFAVLASLGIHVGIWEKPVEIPTEVIPLDEDRAHSSYDPEAANRHFRVLLAAERVFEEFRADFRGKCSPVHFWWGGMDLAVTRFSGRLAPPRPEADSITREGYSEEVSSAGFWPGLGLGEAAFYSYMAPSPPGFEHARVRPAAARWETSIGGQWVLPYEAVRRSASPERTLREFLDSTYEEGARLAGWDRERLEARGGITDPSLMEESGQARITAPEAEPPRPHH